MKTRTAALCLCLLLVVTAGPGTAGPGTAGPGTAGPGTAQSEGPRRPGLLRGIRERLIPTNPVEAWTTARGMPSALEALPLMESLARRDVAESPAAALWLGHFHYGAGDAESALPWFERAAADPSLPVATEARFWAAHCSNLVIQETAAPASPDRIPGSALEATARTDGTLRSGAAAAAWDAYLGLESAARQSGSFGPILYRIARLAVAGDAADVEFVRGHLPGWNAMSGPSPERALVRAMFAAQRPAAPIPPVEEPPRFAEPVDSTDAVGEAATAATGEVAAPGGPEETETPPAYAVQLGSFADAERARREVARLQGLGLPVRLLEETSEGDTLYRIRWGSFRSREEAEESARARCTGLDWAIVRLAAPSP